MGNGDNYWIKILLVEDDENDYILLQTLLSEIEGTAFRLDWVPHYDLAKALIRQNKHEVYLFDSSLGDRSGIELLREAIAEGCKAPIILLTGCGERKTDLEAMKTGAADYLVKAELNAPVLERAIRYALNRSRTLEALQESQEQFALAAAGANDGLWDWNLKTHQIDCSGRWQAIIGLEDCSANHRASYWLKRIHPEDKLRFKTRLVEHLQGKTSHFEAEYRMQHQDGTYRWVLTRGLAIRDAQGEAYRIAGSQTDLSNRRALYDPLTGLANRTLFLDQLERALQEAQSQKDYLLAVLFIDCDRFKIVNDSLGHLIGDQLLIQVAHRLSACLRAGDVVARLGGDEFAVLLENIKGTSHATNVARRLNEALQQSFEVMGHTIYLSASIGVAFNSQKYCQAEDLLRNADTAMYRAKALGKDRYEVFNDSMYAQAQARLQWETFLRQAVERCEFELHYQPIVSLARDRVVGFEALLRWQHPERGLIFPGDFIPLAEETGLIIPISEWILYEACRQMQVWQQQLSLSHPLTVSVNLSRKQFSQPHLADLVAQILQETELDPKSLKLEVTETAIMDQPEETAIALLSQLKELGLYLSVDDFGIGYSSLSCLHSFPIDSLKIDRSFMSNIDIRGKNATIVQAIITLAHSLNIDVTAEGVETTRQLAHLQALQCDYAQGYFFAKPLSADAVPCWLASFFQNCLKKSA
jgi:diguanylate cyclase (GGDEF)-like protein/PAS domain S-box-containing protein